jgi:t-SNARE complex subunit (syntaxin)
LEASQKKLYELYLKDDSKNNSFLENNLITENRNILMNKERSNLQRYKKLHQVRKALTTTEEMGSDIMENMDDQSKNMKNVTNKLKKMGGDLDESNSILNKMRNRVKRNKILVIILAIIFILVLLGIFIFKFTKRNRSEV